MEFLKNTHIDFMKYRRFWAVASTTLVVVAIVAIFFHGKLNIGIDFAGGTQLIAKFQEKPDVDLLRQQLAEAGIPDAQIQRFGDTDSTEIVIRTPLVEADLAADGATDGPENSGAEATVEVPTEGTEKEKDKSQGDTETIIDILSRNYNPDAAGRYDLNLNGTDSLTTHLVKTDPLELAVNDEQLARDEYSDAAGLVLAQRKEKGIFSGWDEITGIDGLAPEISSSLQETAFFGSFSSLGGGFVGPAIGAELRMKGLLAVVFSILVMLIYIWVRFELRFGVGAMLAIIHDVFVTLGLFAILDYELNLSIIAAFLTLVGYSVNDTVVVFDRVRENMRKSRRVEFVQTLNQSINQTLSRTILTSSTTLLAVGSLFFLGGEVLRGFSFVLLIGVIVGTYSSVFVASAFSLLWEEVTTRGRGGASVTTKKSGSRKKARA